MRYFTADLHIGDKAIARWRQAASVEEHDAVLLDAINRTVGAEDELWILGDVCRPNVASVKAVRDAIACEHVSIIVGNHDERSKFLTCGGFETVEYYAEIGKVARDGYKLCLSHYPMLDWNRAIHGAYMLHGHIHSLPAAPGPVPDVEHGGMGMRGYNEWCRAQGRRRFDVGVDACGYAPVSIDQIIAFFDQPA